MLWKRARDPFAGCWALPGGYLERDEGLEPSIRRHLAVKVDVRELAHLEQLETRSDPARNPQEWQVATAYDWQAGPLTCVAFTADGLAGVCGTTGGQLILFDLE